MRVLGIDPGTATTGYAVVEEREGRLLLIALGVISTPAKTPLPSRLQQIYIALREVIADHSPTVSAVE